jgi:DNA-binding transcriptional LysR family regulator
METKWLEDFVSLAETRSFSRSAQLRHVTQPAFSRRIQSLEAWAGIDLVDRSSYPTRLTPAGETLYDQSLEILQAIQSARAMLRGHAGSAHDVIEFAVPHTLAFTFFPAWVSALRETFGPIKSRLMALNVHDAVMRMAEGSCDLLMVYHHPAQPIPLDADRYEMVSLGEEILAPYVKPDSQGAPLYLLPGRASQPLPYLGYASGAYLGQMVDLILKETPTPIHLNRVYETDMAEGLKAMALEGHGVAFLPHSAVVQELAAGRLVSALLPFEEGLQVTMEVRVYREKPASKETPRVQTLHALRGAPVTPRAALHPTKSSAQALWDYLRSQSAAT